jgi:hypothetical protein
MKRKVAFGLVALLLTTSLLVGCMGGGPAATNEKQIHDLLDKYEKAYLQMDTDGIANLLVYPLNFDGEYIANKQQAQFMFGFLFAFIQVEQFKIEDRAIVVDSSGARAGVEATRVQKERGYVTERFPVKLNVRKVDGVWKISGSFI